jgi:hypothetical protein
MATEAKRVRVHSPATDSFPVASLMSGARTEEAGSVYVRQERSLANTFPEFILFHNSSDHLWTAKLADRLNESQSEYRNLQLSVADSNSVSRTNALSELRKSGGNLILAIVVSRAALQED